MTDYGLAGVDLSPETCRECGKPFGPGEERFFGDPIYPAWPPMREFVPGSVGPYHRQCFIDTEPTGPAQVDDDGDDRGI